MKNIQIILLLVFSIFSFQISAQKVKNQKETFEVSGNCDMCKSKIETAAKSVEGVKTARWNVINGNMKVKFNHEQLASISAIVFIAMLAILVTFVN